MLEVFEGMDFYNENFAKDMVPIVFRETVSSDKNPYGSLSPTQGCVRHQFLNYMLKAMIRKNKVQAKSKLTPTQGMQAFMEEHTS
jgi:hypothetical protein